MITGTFLDEITHDIPAQNWGPEEWDADFEAMKAVGIDTVILIRCGYRNRATFDSPTLRALHPNLIVDFDMIDLFLRLSEKHKMTFYFGTYDSGQYWHSGQFQEEADINRRIADEVVKYYGHYPAFGGWYISHEINSFDDGMMWVYENQAAHLKSLKDLPILISPYVRGPKQFASDEVITLDQHEHEWDQVFSRIKDVVDIVAFQDGHVNFDDLPDYLSVNARLAQKYGITCWSNVESFDRDMPWNFPPLNWAKMRYKIEAARHAGVDKLITFEFSHFMSPNSMFPSAQMLYKRYQEYLETAPPLPGHQVLPAAEPEDEEIRLARGIRDE
jgi:hypothetical protein